MSDIDDGSGPAASRLDADDVLERRPDVELSLDATGRVRVAVGDGHVLTGPATLGLLADLARPTTVRELLSRHGVEAGWQSWIDASSDLVHLVQAGVVFRSGDGPTASETSLAAPFDSQTEHALMLEDGERTSAFLAAIAEVVRPGDVVVDIGTGTGVLAIAAARAGARRVFAVESGAIAEVALAMFDGNGVSDRVELVRGWSTDVELPERADVVVSETIGSDPLGERALEIFRDARLRHARPWARFVPERLDLYALACQVPASCARAFTPQRVQDWSRRYATDFSPLLRWQGRRGQDFVRREEVATWQSLVDPVCMASLDLTSVELTRVLEERTVPVRSAGSLDALVPYFSAVLSPSVTLATDPRGGGSSSWRHAVTYLAPTEVAAGQDLTLVLRYQAGGTSGLSVTLP